ncbi:MAG TPA: hypothetical protein VJ834_14345 [Burkholderiales bacterium]|nr:hypothetical protein [Burkholderiales bacterium]
MRKLSFAFAAVAVAALGAFWWLQILTWERHTGYFGPAFSHDGRHVYAVVRETAGFTWGLGWEHFTPPAHAYPLTDSIRLVRIDTASAAEETLERWSTTPVLERVIAEYRGRVFNSLRATVRPDAAGGVRYDVEMAIPVVPSSEMHVLSGNWAPQENVRRRGEWQRGQSPVGPSSPVLSDQTEVFALRGPESFPCALVLLDHRTMTTRVLAHTAAYASRYPSGPPLAALLEVSRKKDIDRIAEVERARGALVAKFREAGASEIEALLKTHRALEDSGYLPKSPRLVARELTPQERDASRTLALFEIADAEMASGIFPDIQQALAAPGTEIDKSMGKYIVHNDYANSRLLNAHLASGAREFLVRFRGATYRIEIRHGR